MSSKKNKDSTGNSEILGVDIGGSGIKAAVVNVERGTLTTDRIRIPTPQPATPEAVIFVIEELQQMLKWDGPVGCGFPGVMKKGEVSWAPNLDESWIGFELEKRLKKHLNAPRLAVGNDADVAGVAEMQFGAGRGELGTVMVVTLGTGIGTALFRNGMLIPFTELGHIEIDGKAAEERAAHSVREKRELSWKKWGRAVDRYLATLEHLLSVDLFLIGGGVSDKPEKFFPHLNSVTCPIQPAQMGNLAGIVGAALIAK